MYSQEQETLLEEFAYCSDLLFDLGVIRTDSFTGEIGEYYACSYFNLKIANRSAKAVDAFSIQGVRFQVKSKVVKLGASFTYNISGLESGLFDKLVVVFMDERYDVLKMLSIDAEEIIENKVNIRNSNLNLFIDHDISHFMILPEIKKAINVFAHLFNKLEVAGIVRSRRVVGDIGEYYACKRLNLELSNSLNQKGFDAIDIEGRTFEIKTRRVYQSDRRTSERRRLNKLEGKSAVYLIVVTIDRGFRCSGMWIMPIKNIENMKSASLEIVNYTPGTLNLIPSKVSFLNSGYPFQGFDNLHRVDVIEKVVSRTKNVQRPQIIYQKPIAKKKISNESNSWLILIIICIVVILIMKCSHMQ